jgi:GNAT superfamily N-acetyltransferase
MAGATTLNIVPAKPDDLPAILELMRHLSPGDSPVDPAIAQESWRRLLEGDTTEILVGWLGDRAVSTCMLVIVPNLTRGCRPYALIENVVTHADLRGKGFGQATMKAATDRAKHAGCYKIMLMTGRTEEQVFRFYESCGFDRHSKTAFQMRLL